MTPPVWLCDMTEDPVTLPDCLACAQALCEPGCPVADTGLLTALHRSLQDDPVLAAVRGLGLPVVRVSSLVGCTRQAWYARSAGYPLETPSRLWPRLRGTIWHRGLEREGESEERLVTRLELPTGQSAIVAGRADLFWGGVLTDFKTISGARLTPRCPTHQLPMRRGKWGWFCSQVVGRSGGKPEYCKERTRDGFAGLALPKPHHVEQLALYSWLIQRVRGETVERAQLVYISMSEVRRVDVPAPDGTALAQIETSVTARVQAIVQDAPPPGNPQEAWECRYCPFKSQCPDRLDRASP